MQLRRSCCHTLRWLILFSLDPNHGLALCDSSNHRWHRLSDPFHRAVPRQDSPRAEIGSDCILAGPIGVAWSAIGFYLLLHPADRKTHISLVLDHIKYNLAGMLLGIFLTLLLNPEFYRLMRDEIRLGLTKRWSEPRAATRQG
jgi:hypothetical protein